MKNTKFAAVAIGLYCGTSLLNAATTLSYSFWGYDQYAGGTPYYSHYQILTPSNALVAVANLNHGNPYVYTTIESGGNTLSATRSIGWHNYQFDFNLLTRVATISYDSTAIASGTYTLDPAKFVFVLHDHIGGPQETIIDDFEFRVDGVLEYQSGFESESLDPVWAITRQDAGNYITSGDPSNPHSGLGAFALGSTTYNNVASIVEFTPTADMLTVPEPSSLVPLACFLSSSAFFRIRRKSTH